MEAEDNNIAHNMHAAIMNAMSSSRNMSANSNACSNVGTGTCAGSKDDVGPRQRFRSSSANEASKPISVLQRRHTGAKLHGFSPLGKKMEWRKKTSSFVLLSGLYEIFDSQCLILFWVDVKIWNLSCGFENSFGGSYFGELGGIEGGIKEFEGF